MVIPHEWKNEPHIKTTPIQCFICSDPAAVIIYAPEGCTCSPNKIQPRCYHHLLRALDTDEEFTIIEDFRIPHDKTSVGHRNDLSN